MPPLPLPLWVGTHVTCANVNHDDPDTPARPVRAAAVLHALSHLPLHSSDSPSQAQAATHARARVRHHAAVRCGPARARSAGRAVLPYPCAFRPVHLRRHRPHAGRPQRTSARPAALPKALESRRACTSPKCQAKPLKASRHLGSASAIKYSRRARAHSP